VERCVEHEHGTAELTERVCHDVSARTLVSDRLAHRVAGYREREL